MFPCTSTFSLSPSPSPTPPSLKKKQNKAKQKTEIRKHMFSEDKKQNEETQWKGLLRNRFT